MMVGVEGRAFNKPQSLRNRSDTRNLLVGRAVMSWSFTAVSKCDMFAVLLELAGGLVVGPHFKSLSKKKI